MRNSSNQSGNYVVWLVVAAGLLSATISILAELVEVTTTSTVFLSAPAATQEMDMPGTEGN